MKKTYAIILALLVTAPLPTLAEDLPEPTIHEKICGRKSFGPIMWCTDSWGESYMNGINCSKGEERKRKLYAEQQERRKKLEKIKEEYGRELSKQEEIRELERQEKLQIELENKKKILLAQKKERERKELETLKAYRLAEAERIALAKVKALEDAKKEKVKRDQLVVSLFTNDELYVNEFKRVYTMSKSYLIRNGMFTKAQDTKYLYARQGMIQCVQEQRKDFVAKGGLSYDKVEKSIMSSCYQFAF